MPTGKQICEKQLIKVIDELEKVKVNEEEITDFMPEIYRKLEWLSKEDLIKRMVSHEFNRFWTTTATVKRSRLRPTAANVTHMTAVKEAAARQRRVSPAYSSIWENGQFLPKRADQLTEQQYTWTNRVGTH